MAIQYSSGGGNATITLTYTALKAKIDVVLLNAAHNLFDQGYGNHGTGEAPRLWSDLTNQERLNLIDECVKRTIVQEAKAYHVSAGIEAARQIANSELGSYDI